MCWNSSIRRLIVLLKRIYSSFERFAYGTYISLKRHRLANFTHNISALTASHLESFPHHNYPCCRIGTYRFGSACGSRAINSRFKVAGHNEAVPARLNPLILAPSFIFLFLLIRYPSIHPSHLSPRERNKLAAASSRFSETSCISISEDSPRTCLGDLRCEFYSCRNKGKKRAHRQNKARGNVNAFFLSF